MENKYINKLKEYILDFLENEEVKVFLFGSRAKGDNAPTSDVDIGLLPHKNGTFDRSKVSLLKEKIEDLNIPYKVEIVTFDETSNDFKKFAMKDIVIWKN
ncbi:MAG: hypothetical protein A3B68_09455 [Candidatus Melainabacteria bacterium RIFCSPHIGHO2_02_FULL_34_12]|nr:MAG: hypothetical protein A3B68_09455 [Candidatus Melainabacteria bacterium RIFCSPHIGHO2_02_FULL_34_12]